MPGATIGWYDILVDIVVPLLSALIGGLLTMLGVVYTIKNERNKSEEQTIQDAKPWLFSLVPLDEYDYKKASTIILRGSEPLDENMKLQFIIKNTDNGVGIIEKFETENNVYFPCVGRILDKNSISHVDAVVNKWETLKDMFLYVKDIYGNRYKYKVLFDEEARGGYRIEEVEFIPTKMSRRKA